MNDNGVRMKQPLRDQIQRDVEAFKARGGRVVEVPVNAHADERDWGEQISGMARRRGRPKNEKP